MNLLKLSHASWQDDDGRPVEVSVLPEQVFSVFFMPANKATAVVGPGGAHVLVLESVNEVLEKLNQCLKKETINE